MMLAKPKPLFIFALVLSALMVLMPFPAFSINESADTPEEENKKKEDSTRGEWTTTDHSRLKPLQGDFRSGDEITAACLSCHSEAASQFHKTLHWTWIDPASKENFPTGKAGYSLNNFCISTNGMKDKKCSSCHTGWNGKKGAVNCLVCHGKEKFNWEETFADLEYFSSEEDEDSREFAQEVLSSIRTAAQNVGRPDRRNCGSCHFMGGGGDGVKHGDLDTSLINPAKALDVHMDADGENFQCTRCHTTVQHRIAGRIYSTPAVNERKSLIQDDLTAKITCESCHTATPHEPGHKANDHTDKVACQSCHIPTFARVKPTKIWWDWSKAGKLKDGKPYTEEGPLGKEDYMSIKGEMKWAKDVKPEYFWFNGSIETLTAKDKIDPYREVKVAWPTGEAGDPDSRIFPFKVHRGTTPYDIQNKTILTPLLSGENGFWTTFDWQRSFKLGADYLDLDYSGDYGFAPTSYVFPITHMVAPKENVVGCSECHVKNTGRLASLGGFYMPGRDREDVVNFFGWAVVIGSVLGVGLHGFGRFLSRKNGKSS